MPPPALDEHDTILWHIKTLRAMTVDGGYEEAAVEDAATKLGRYLQDNPLHVCWGMCQAPAAAQPTLPLSGPKPGREYAPESSYYRPHKPDEPYEYGDVKVIALTELGIRLEDDGGERFWMPRSQLHEDCEDWIVGDEGILFVSQWWAKKQGWV